MRLWFPHLLALAAVAACLPGLASARSSNGVRAEVIVCGSTAQEFTHRSTTYVEARDGCEYAIVLSNDTADRVAVHLSVDGLNTIDASQSSPSSGPRWVLEPWQSATIPGWQTGSGTSRRFYFTTADQSYADWIGDTSDAGYIKIVAYRERRPTPPPVYIDPGWDWSSSRGAESEDRGGYQDWDGAGASRKSSAADESAAAPRSQTESYSPRRWRDERAATGIGRETSHHVNTTSFDAERYSFSRITLRYGYHDQLVSWGVFPRRHEPCWCCDGYAPDPNDYYDHRCR